MDVKHHAFLSVVLAAVYMAFLGGNPVGALMVLAVGVGMDIDHLFAYLYRTRCDFRAGFLKRTYAHYRRVMDWLYFRKGEPYTAVEFMPFHVLEVALLAGFLVGRANPELFLPMALGYAGHMGLDLVCWHRIVFKSRTRTAAQMAEYLFLSYRLFLGPGIAPR